MSDETKESSPGAAGGGGPFGRLFSARPEGSRYPKAELLPRLLARLTDFILASFFPLSIPEGGVALAVLFLLFADGMFHGQSPGKKLLGIKVVHVPTGLVADYRESALRNFPFSLILLAILVPTAGQFVFWTLGPALVVFEGWRVLSDKLGLRLGDLLARTQVVDTKVVVGAALRPKLEIVRTEAERVRGAVRVLLEPPPAEPPRS